MNWRRHVLEAATLIGAAIVCALVANAMASRDRKVTLAPTPPPVKVAAPAPAVETPPVASTETVAPPAATETRAAEGAGVAPLKTVAVRPAKTTTTTAPKPAAKEFKAHPDKPYIEISYDDVAALHAANALFLDARRTSVYQQGHIAGARPFSVWESDIDEKVNNLFGERSDPREQEKPIVVYCSGGDCEDSHMLAQKLWGIQFNNVYVYKDGFPDWQKRAGAVHSGDRP